MDSKKSIERAQRKMDESELKPRTVIKPVEELFSKEDVLRQAKKIKEKLESEMNDLEKKLAFERKEKATLVEQIQTTCETILEDKDSRVKLTVCKHELDVKLRDLVARIKEAEKRNQAFATIKSNLTSKIQDLERQIKVDEADRQIIKQEKCALDAIIKKQEEIAQHERCKSDAKDKKPDSDAQLAKRVLDAKVKKLEEENGRLANSNNKLVKEMKLLEERLTEVSKSLSEEEERANSLSKLKIKYEETIRDLEKRFSSDKSSKLEKQLELEVKEKEAATEAARKFQERLKQVSIQIIDERIHSNLFKVQIEKANSRVKGLKRQLEEIEKEYSKEKDNRRKAKRDLEDAVEANEVLSKEIAVLKNKIRRSEPESFTRGL